MITLLRSALLCDRVTQDPDGRVSLHGLYGETIWAGTRPGAVKLWMGIMCDLDGRETRAELHLKSDDFVWTFPFERAAGLRASMAMYEFIVPILQRGALTLEIHDEARNGKPLRVRWELGFNPDARDMDEKEARDLIEATHKFNEGHRASPSPGATKH